MKIPSGSFVVQTTAAKRPQTEEQRSKMEMDMEMGHSERDARGTLQHASRFFFSNGSTMDAHFTPKQKKHRHCG